MRDRWQQAVIIPIISRSLLLQSGNHEELLQNAKIIAVPNTFAKFAIDALHVDIEGINVMETVNSMRWRITKEVYGNSGLPNRLAMLFEELLPSEGASLETKAAHLIWMKSLVIGLECPLLVTGSDG